MSAQTTGITVSISFGDKNYGLGSETFINQTIRWNDEDNPSLEEVMDHGCEAYFNLWQTLMVDRCTTGVLQPTEFKLAVGSALLRAEKVKNVLAKLKNSSPEELTELVENIKTEKRKRIEGKV